MNTVCKEHEWVSVKEALPDRHMRVRWLCIDGTKDVGFFNKDSGEFLTVDMACDKEITHWQTYWPVKPRDFKIKENLKVISDNVDDEFVEWLDEVIEFNIDSEINILKQVKEKYLEIKQKNT